MDILGKVEKIFFIDSLHGSFLRISPKIICVDTRATHLSTKTSSSRITLLSIRVHPLLFKDTAPVKHNLR
jgi:hypothetical protein